MNIIIRNSLAVVTGLVLGSVVNMGIIMISSSIIPPPDGVDTTSMESLKTSMHLFEPRHFIMPFLAHALGTFVGAFLAAIISLRHNMKLALSVGLFFLVGGTINIFMLPSPIWFVFIDIALAYIPMAWLGWKLAQGFKS